jgi:hypothetical protein
VIVPARGEVLALASTVYCTVPLPVLDVPAVTVIHGALLVAFHAHTDGDVTVTDPVPPVSVNDLFMAESVKVQAAGGGGSCVTVTACPATASEPTRAAGSVFAAAVYWTVPLPVPLAPVVIVSHGT